MTGYQILWGQYRMKYCYDKKISYVIPQLKCEFCSEKINPGEELHTVTLKWGSGYSACKRCADDYQIDWSLHLAERED